MLSANHGWLLEVSLSTGGIAPRKVPEEQFRRYLGGSGLGARLLYDELDPKLDPLAPEAPLLLMNGLLTGTPVACCNKVCLCARSPLTGIWGESRAGGYFGAELAKTGISGVLFRGQAPEPVYLWIHARAEGTLKPELERGTPANEGDSGVPRPGSCLGVGRASFRNGNCEVQIELRSAKELWGKDTIETAEAIRAATDPRAQVGAIGPAGERLVRFANVMFGGVEARAAGRTGLGAVMGAKRLKAVVARASCPCPTGWKPVPPGMVGVARPDELREEMLAVNRKARDDAGRLRDYGTAGGVIAVEAAGDLPIKNWQLGDWEAGALKIAPQTLFPRLLKRHYACFACPIRCGKVYRVPDGPYAGLEGHAPEYETVAGFGALCLNDDPDTIVKANDLCNRYGLDTISTSAAIAFAMEAFERGLLTGTDFGGAAAPSDRSDSSDRSDRSDPPSPRPEPRWGSPAAILSLIHQIARREGIGRLLGEGVRRAALALGGDAASFAIHTKGLEYPFHDPRAFISMGPSYATGSRGACHMESFSYILGYGSPMPDLGYERGSVEPQDHAGAARMAVVMQDLMAVYDALGMCKFLSRGGVGPSQIAKWINLVTGWDLTAADLMLAGERLFNLKRAYNLRCGVRREDDALPARIEHLDRGTGAAAGSLPDMPRLLAEYYALRGWDPRGFPSPDRLRHLGLDDVAADLRLL